MTMTSLTAKVGRPRQARHQDDTRVQNPDHAWSIGFHRWLAAVTYLLASVVGAGAAEQSDSIWAVCAARDLQFVILLEQHGEAQDVASDKLAGAFFTMMRARKACTEGRLNEAETIYDSIALQPTGSAERP